MAAPARPAQAPPASFLAGATVLLLSGLPGDVESEAAYEGDLRSLLEVLARPALWTGQVHVLVDAPERVRFPAGLLGKVRGNTRADVRALGSELAGGAPLVVMAWGHGGMQGTTSVLHVRGPRLTPEDFAALARQAGARPSRWVLFFRGSGEFARALAAPGREVLASEGDVRFRSDPIGFGLLVRALREAPAVGFPDLAARLGRATAEWYEGQHLARTEEPTLWPETGPPRRVAAATSSRTPAAKPDTTRPDTANPDTANPDASAPAPAETSPAWAAVSPVAAERYPGAPAVVLLRRTTHIIGDAPALAEETDEFIQVLGPEGERYGDVDVAFSPPDERVTFLDAEIRTPGGRVERLDPASSREAPPEVLGPYRTPARKVFSFPGVRPGVVIRLHYHREWQRFPLPHVILEIPLSAEIPIVTREVAVRVSERTPLHHAWSGRARMEPTVERSPYGVTYAWRVEDAAGEPAEALRAPFGRPRLLVSTFPDWTAFVSWYRRLILEADRVTPEIEAKAAEVTRGLLAPRAKVVALYNYVSALRYIAIPLGVNSHRPHAAARVLENRYGDCKDKATLFNTLLRTQGIAADLVLAPRFSEAFEEAPGVGFNHALSRVRLGGDVLWVDTTDELARFGLLPPGDPGRKVLVVDAASAGLVQLPDPEPAAHSLTVRARLRAEGEAFAGRIEAAGTGFVDYALRQAARQAAGEIASRPVLGELMRPVSGVLEVARQSHTRPGDLEESFSWTAEGAFAGLGSAVGERRLVRAPFWLPLEWDLAVHARRAPLFLNQGYPLALREEIDITLPAGTEGALLPAPRNETHGPLRFRTHWNRAEAGALRATLEVDLARGELRVDETAAVQSGLRALFDAVAQGATYAPPRTTAEPTR